MSVVAFLIIYLAISLKILQVYVGFRLVQITSNYKKV